ncbi:MAG: polysaccharide deacetylase family protein [bacterium]|nr:polysaccharide deacetylase family protein [bacterium]
MRFHFLSVDLESAHHAANLQARLRRLEDRPLKEQLGQRVVYGTRRLLRLFHQFQTQATFFVLGEVARQHPALIDEIAAAGHRIASHGLGHRRVFRQDLGDFQRDLAESLALLRPWEAAWGGGPGYRAPDFSLPPLESHYEALRSAGFAWSSSLMAARLSPRLLAGVPAERRRDLVEGRPHQVTIPSGSIREYPLAGRRILGQPLAWGGGFWLRALPMAWNLSHMRDWNRGGRSFHLYVHPWELDLEQPRLRLPVWRSLRQYHGLERFEGRLERVLGEFRFQPIGEE